MQVKKIKTETECTVGVIHIAGGILFFKNRDLREEHLSNKLTVFHSTPEFHALKGVNLETNAMEGISIGVNKYNISVANTHIESSQEITYDILCERLLTEAQGKDDIPRIAKDFMSQNTVQGGRILVAAPNWTYLIEVFNKEYQIIEVEKNFVITNNFSLISHQAKRPKIREESSLARLETARGMINKISNVGMLKSMLRSHIPEKGELSICNHQESGGGTESSHIIQIMGDYTGWSALVGFPCENDYDTIQLFQD